MCVRCSRSSHHCPRCEEYHPHLIWRTPNVIVLYPKLCHCGFYFYFLYVRSPSFLFAALFRGPQFTLYTGINVWPRQAWLTVPVYICVLLFFVITHRSTVLSVLISALINKYNSLTVAPKYALHAPSKIFANVVKWTVIAILTSPIYSIILSVLPGAT